MTLAEKILEIECNKPDQNGCYLNEIIIDGYRECVDNAMREIAWQAWIEGKFTGRVCGNELEYYQDRFDEWYNQQL